MSELRKSFKESLDLEERRALSQKFREKKYSVPIVLQRDKNSQLGECSKEM